MSEANQNEVPVEQPAQPTGPRTIRNYPIHDLVAHEDGTYSGRVTIPGGEVHDAVWSADGFDTLGGRPKFKLNLESLDGQ